MATTKILNYNGRPAIMIDGKPYPPMMATITTTKDNKRYLDEEYYKNLGKSGIKIFFVICDTEWAVPNAFEQFQLEAETILRAVPDAYLMLRIGLHPSPEWCEANPDETLCYSDGKKKPMHLGTESLEQDYPSMYSLSSQKWREEASKYLLELYDKIEALPYANRIAGYFFAAGGTSEWYYLTPMQYTNKTKYSDTGGFDKVSDRDYEDVYADLSPAFQKEFSKYLKAKYKTEENLKKAWRDETASFEHPGIPGCEERYYIDGVDYDLNHPVRMHSNAIQPMPLSNGTNIGHFIDLRYHMDVHDFFRALHTGTANSVIHFGKVIKERSNGTKLTGAFYGAAGVVRFHDFSQSGDVYDILTSDAIDFLASPGVYENRQPGGFIGQRQVFDSFALHNRIYVVEDDSRTHHEIAYHRNNMELYDIEDTCNVLKRDFGRNLMEDTHAWWFDQHIGGGRYKDEDIYKLFAKQQEIAHQVYEKDRTKNSEIAFIYDEESLHVVSEETTHQMVELFRNYEIDIIGAPSDRYFHNDLQNLNMPDYKLYVFVNAFYLTDAERSAIKEKLKKNHATALFMYGSGCINPDREEILSADNITDLTGIKTAMNNNVVRGKFKFYKDENILSGRLDKGDIYGDFKRKMWPNASSNGNVYVYKNARVNLYPEFYSVDEQGINAAYLLENHHPALTIKEVDGFRSIYCASKYLCSDVMREIARYAGCHIYVENNDILYANKNYVVLHAAKSGDKTIMLPRPASAYEVYEEQYYSENSCEIKCTMLKGETKMFELKFEKNGHRHWTNNATLKK